MMRWLWVLGIIISIGSVILAGYETFEAWEHSFKPLWRTGTKLVCLWLVAGATIGFTILSLDDIAEKNALLDSPELTQKDHDKFVAALKDVPKGDVQILVGGSSGRSAIFVKDLRRMFDDAGYGVHAPDKGIVALTDPDIIYKDGRHVYYAFNDASDAQSIPAYSSKFCEALQFTEPNLSWMILSKYVKPGRLSIVIVDNR